MDGLEVHSHHPHPVGHRVFDFIVGGSALLISCVSLFVAVQHGRTMEKLVQANSYPNVEIAGGIESTGKPGEIALSTDLTNNGVGPARIESIELWENGVPVHSASEIVDAIKSAASAAHGHTDLEASTVIGSLIGAGKTKTLIRLKFADGADWYPALAKVLFGMESRVCYCSVFDECHVSDSRVRRGIPTAVKECPEPAVPYSDDLKNVALSKPGATPGSIDLSTEPPKP
jgi:hypothetical protein